MEKTIIFNLYKTERKTHPSLWCGWVVHCEKIWRIKMYFLYLYSRSLTKDKYMKKLFSILSIYDILLFGVPIGNKFGSFIEYYNDVTMNIIHGGVTYIPHRDIQLDINGGWIDGWTLTNGISVVVYHSDLGNG